MKKKRTNAPLTGWRHSLHWLIFETSLWQYPKARSSVKSSGSPTGVYHYLLSWWWLSGLQLTRCFILLPSVLPSFCCQFSYWQNGSSPLTFSSSHTIPGDYYSRHTIWWPWRLFPWSCPLSLYHPSNSSFLSFRVSAKFYGQANIQQRKRLHFFYKSNLQKWISLSILHPNIFEIAYLKTLLSLNRYPLYLLYFFDQEWTGVVVAAVTGLLVTLLI